MGASRAGRILVAARAYLAERGRPETPEDLAGRTSIRMSNIGGGARLPLRGRDGSSILTPFEGRLRVDHGLAAREALAQGRRIAAAHIWLVDDLLAAGTVEQILPDFTPEPVPLSLLVVPGRTRIKRVRMLVDALAASLATLPGLDRK